MPENVPWKIALDLISDFPTLKRILPKLKIVMFFQNYVFKLCRLGKTYVISSLHILNSNLGKINIS